MAVGETGPSMQVRNLFENVLPVMKDADLRFAQVERTFSNRGTFREGLANLDARRDPRLVKDYEAADFDVVSLAFNHAMDWGPEAVIDTIRNFNKIGVATIGAGSNISEARKPAILKKKGIIVGFLGYCSVLPLGYWATETRAGLNPLRARTYYEAPDFQPATPAHVFSLSDKADLERMKQDIKQLRSAVDVVVVSMHWGVHYLPGYVADYQIEAGHAAMDAGCDLILGHHSFIMKGVEIYKGKPILYGLPNFGVWGLKQKHRAPSDSGERFTFSETYDADFGPGLKYNHRQYTQLSTIAEIHLGKEGVERLQFVPASFDNNHRPEQIRPGNTKFDEIKNLLAWSSERFGTEMEVKGDRVVVKM